MVTHLGNDKPSVKHLHDHVVENVANNWRNLGVQLLPPDRLNLLNILEENNPRDVVSCRNSLFEKWLEITADATWNQLIGALRAMQLYHIAAELEQKLATECKISF